MPRRAIKGVRALLGKGATLLDDVFKKGRGGQAKFDLPPFIAMTGITESMHNACQERGGCGGRSLHFRFGQDSLNKNLFWIYFPRYQSHPSPCYIKIDSLLLN